MSASERYGRVDPLNLRKGWDGVGMGVCVGSGCSSETQDFVIEGLLDAGVHRVSFPARSLHFLCQTEYTLNPARLGSHMPTLLEPLDGTD